MLQEQQVKELLYDSLSELGLTNNEISFYTLSLSRGPTNISSLAAALRMPRPNVYKLIASLEEKGLAKFSTRAKRSRKFVVESPTIVKELLEKKQASVSKLSKQVVSSLPDLLALHHQGGQDTNIKVIKGKDELLRVYFDILDEEKKQTEFFGDVSDFIKLISWEDEMRWMRERIKKKVHVKGLFTPTIETSWYGDKGDEIYREFRVLKDSSPFKTSFQLYANKVIIFQPNAPLSLLIEDKYIVDMLRSMFYMLWKNSSMDVSDWFAQENIDPRRSERKTRSTEQKKKPG